MASTHLPAGSVIQPPAVELPEFARRWANLANEDFGARVLSCSDEFFAPAQRMLQAAEPVFVVGKFDNHGKWMDGWESRRKREAGFDTAIVQLGLPGRIVGVDIDTSHFTGNYPSAAALQACFTEGEPDDATVWTDLIPPRALKGNSHHFIELPPDSAVWSHLRLTIYPDGGVARLRVYGQPVCRWDTLPENDLYEVSALASGGRIVAYNDAHFGVPFRLIMPGRGVNMGDGWETRRRREPGNDWCIIQLGHPAHVERIEVDTAHFKGNYPDQVSLQAAYVPHSTDESLVTQAMFWSELLPPQKTSMDVQHFFEGDAIRPLGPVTHVKLNMFPDGGISRLRVWGRLARPGDR